MWDLKACRSCLATQLHLEKTTETLSRLYSNVTGLQFKPGDGFPNYFCVECLTQLKKCLIFRRKSRRAYFALQTTMNTQRQITKKDVEQINRRENNLTSSLGKCIPSTFHCVKVVNDFIKEEIPTLSLSAKEFYNQFQSTDSKVLIDTEPTVEIYKPSNEGNVCQIIEIESCTKTSDVVRDNSQSLIADVAAVLEDDNVTKIDLDDVFKDLEEEVKTDNDDDENVPELWDLDPIKLKNEIHTVKMEHRNKVAKLTTTKEIIDTAKMLDNCEMIPQSLEEMRRNYKDRTQRPPYVNARFKCIICIKVYPTMEKLLGHVKFHNRPGAVVSCKVCSLRTTTEDELLIHEAEEHHYLYHCQKCAKMYYTLREFKSHMKMEHASTSAKSFDRLKQYFDIVEATQQEMFESLDNFFLPKAVHECEECKMKFKEKAALRLHIYHHKEPTPKTVMCDICKLWRRNKGSLETHMKNFHKYKYICKECDDVVFTRVEAKYHVTLHKEKNEKEILDQDTECEHCHRNFFTRQSLMMHKMKVHFSKQFCHHCIACGLSFSVRQTLYKHQLIEHKRIILPSPYLDEIQFMCQHCQVQFLTEDAYKKHVVKHRHPEAKEIPLACVPCRTIFTNETEYNKHLRVCRAGAMYPRDCNYCEVVLKSASESVRHYSRCHAGLVFAPLPSAESRYTLCEHCGESIHMTRIHAHKRLHDKKAPTCNICDVRFPTPEALASHGLSKHTVRPYRCALCPAAYQARRNARDHILKTHAPVRPFSCKWCPLKFSHIDFMNEHTTKIHNAKTEKPKKPRTNDVFCTYPHMKVDISQISKDVIAKIKLKICDYHDQNTTVLQNYAQFFLTNPTPLDSVYHELLPQDRSRIAGKHASKKRKTNKTKENVVKKPKKEIKDDVNGKLIGGEALGYEILAEIEVDNEVELKLGEDAIGAETLREVEGDHKEKSKLEGNAIGYKILREIELENEAKSKVKGNAIGYKLLGKVEVENEAQFQLVENALKNETLDDTKDKIKAKSKLRENAIGYKILREIEIENKAKSKLEKKGIGYKILGQIAVENEAQFEFVENALEDETLGDTDDEDDSKSKVGQIETLGKIKDENNANLKLGENALEDETLVKFEDENNTNMKLGENSFEDETLRETEDYNATSLGEDELVDETSETMEVVNEVNVQSEMEFEEQEELVLDEGIQYEVIEQDGEQYVVVDNTLYKLETQ